MEQAINHKKKKV